MHLFCFGLGYTAKYIFSKISPICKVSGTHRKSDSLKENEYIFNDQEYFDKDILNDVTHILISIPPTENGDPVYIQLYKYLKTLKNLEWIGYYSSSSVYGDHQGEWVDELSDAKAFESLGRNRLTAEKQWLESNLPVNILRLSSIYGPKRSAFDIINSGRATRILKENHYFSRIHVEDLADITIKIMNNPKLNEIYNISDDSPTPNHQVITYACKLMKVEAPKMIKFEDADLSLAMANYYKSSKRVSNNKVKQDYDVKLTFPSYREGLDNIFNESTFLD